MQQEILHIIIGRLHNCTDEALLDFILNLLVESGY
jgi:hypothetical protein